MAICLGDSVKDCISGFSGTVIGSCNYLTGCRQHLVQPKSKSAKEFIESRWFDEDRLSPDGGKKAKLQVTVAGPDKPAPRK